MKVAAVAWFVLTFVACAQRIPVTVPGEQNIRQEAYRAIGSAEPESASQPPKISLEAYPLIGLAPMRVTFHATLNHVSSSDMDFACLKEEWTFGDGAVSAETRNCVPPFQPQEAGTEFVRDYVFNRPGTYEVLFGLGENQLRSNKVTIRVMSQFH